MSTASRSAPWSTRKHAIASQDRSGNVVGSSKEICSHHKTVTCYITASTAADAAVADDSEGLHDLCGFLRVLFSLQSVAAVTELTGAGSSPKILGGIAALAPSSPSPFYPFSETEKIRTPYRPTSFQLAFESGATSESGGTCPLTQRRTAPG